MSKTDCSRGQLTFGKLGQQQVTADFSGGRVVSDAGLPAVRRMERGLGVLSELGRRLPDPRSQKFVTHDCERILVQGVYQILAGYFDYTSGVLNLRFLFSRDPTGSAWGRNAECAPRWVAAKRNSMPRRVYSSNAVLRRRTELKQRYAQALCELYDEKQQFFQIIDDYQAGGRPHPRRIIAKVEALPQAVYVLFREANASVPEVAGKEVATLRRQLFKAGAVVETSVRRIGIHFSGHWPRRALFVRICEAVDRYLAGFLPEPTANGPPRDLLRLG